MKNLLRLAALCLTVLVPVMAHAATIDQNNPTVNAAFCYTFAGNLCGQSFQQNASNISGAGIYADPNYGAAPQTVTISIYSSYSTGLIASGTSGIVDHTSGWIDVFWTPAAITPSTTYYMVVASSVGNIVATYSIADYPLGNVVYGGCADCNTTYDLTFRTWADGAVVTPEPASLALLGLGLVGLGLIRRKQA